MPTELWLYAKSALFDLKVDMIVSLKFVKPKVY